MSTRAVLLKLLSLADIIQKIGVQLNGLPREDDYVAIALRQPVNLVQPLLNRINLRLIVRAKEV